MKLNNFNYKPIFIEDDYEGEVKATFITANFNTNTRPSVLYIHGFIDYFFHPHLADFFDQNGFDFYAIELRKYGHSMLPHQHPNYCRSLDEYFMELDACMDVIRQENPEPISILGHSTGGLLAAYYLNKGKKSHRTDNLILNSPFLEMNVPSFARPILKPLAKLVSDRYPYAKLDGMLPPIYPSSVHKDYKGEWDFDLKLKPIEGFPVYFKWSRAIMDAQDWLKENSRILDPILLMHSSDSYLPKKHEPRVMKSDIVLNVEHMKKYGPGLGRNVELVEIKDGIHDLFLSPSPVREEAMNKMITWLKAQIKAAKPVPRTPYL